MAAAAHGGVTYTQLNNIPAVTSGITGLLNDRAADAATAPTVPSAYINYIFFDEQFNVVKDAGGNTVAGFSKVGSNSVVKTHTDLTNKTAPKNGYVYIYVSNESPVNVFPACRQGRFDNLQVIHTRGAILEETHYYPFGLVMSGISSKAFAFGNPENKRGYNGNEIQNKEFSDGSGLEFYDFKFRGYDAQIGRFMQIDPLADMSFNYSPYAYGNNNPILLNDPLGLASDTAWKVLQEVVVTAKRKASSVGDWVTGRDVGYTGSGWGHGPRRWLANQLGLGNKANNLIELGLHSQLQSSQVNLSGDLLERIKNDPDMIAH
ncbi:MAG: RHS repeat-associated core domain-containing protein [Chitinophagaceae bacterium]|nr:RHS repeat-associated core domain-containing protein [Chitinophagaceae bacterium]